MNKFKKVVLLSAVLIIPLLSLTGCSQVSLTGTTTNTPNNGEMGTPPDGGTPPTDGGTPPAGAPAN
jgi:hypothetical protein